MDRFLAYIGPGAGLGFIGSLLAVLAVIALGFLGLVLYPLKLVIAWFRGRPARQQSSESPATAQNPVGRLS
jgi:hypothetical protein